MTPYPRRFATIDSEGLFAAYTYTFGIAPNNCSDHDKPVLPRGDPEAILRTVHTKVQNGVSLEFVLQVLVIRGVLWVRG